MIDPGHGGEDPGALGPAGAQEKRVVLEIAKKLRDLFNREPGVKAFLTRDNDYFIPLRRRWKTAKEYCAQAFISVHANGSFDPQKKGAEVYCLSPGGAGQEAARILADKENASDLLGGVDLSACSAEVDSILVNMVQTRTINDGLILGKISLDQLTKINPVNFAVPQQAGFAVLKAPDIPSVLVEVGYITNPQEEQLLTSAPFQARVAEALQQSLLFFFEKLRGERGTSHDT